jgi:hypothetical protein
MKLIFASLTLLLATIAPVSHANEDPAVALVHSVNGKRCGDSRDPAGCTKQVQLLPVVWCAMTDRLVAKIAVIAEREATGEISSVYANNLAYQTVNDEYQHGNDYAAFWGMNIAYAMIGRPDVGLDVGPTYQASMHQDCLEHVTGVLAPLLQAADAVATGS